MHADSAFAPFQCKEAPNPFKKMFYPWSNLVVLISNLLYYFDLEGQRKKNTFKVIGDMWGQFNLFVEFVNFWICHAFCIQQPRMSLCFHFSFISTVDDRWISLWQVYLHLVMSGMWNYRRCSSQWVFIRLSRSENSFICQPDDDESGSRKSLYTGWLGSFPYFAGARWNIRRLVQQAIIYVYYSWYSWINFINNFPRFTFFWNWKVHDDYLYAWPWHKRWGL